VVTANEELLDCRPEISLAAIFQDH
jgi:hypothetical protein